MGQRITCSATTGSTGGELFRFEFWMRGGARAPPLHVHPRQEERIRVLSGSVRSISGGIERVLGTGETVVSPPGEPHTVGPAGDTAVEMLVEFRPALGFEAFVERTFALDRAGRLNAKGQGNPLRVATARPHDARSSTYPASPSARSERYSAHWIGLADGSTRAPDDCRARKTLGLLVSMHGGKSADSGAACCLCESDSRQVSRIVRAQRSDR